MNMNEPELDKIFGIIFTLEQLINLWFTDTGYNALWSLLSALRYLARDVWKDTMLPLV